MGQRQVHEAREARQQQAEQRQTQGKPPLGLVEEMQTKQQ